MTRISRFSSLAPLVGLLAACGSEIGPGSGAEVPTAAASAVQAGKGDEALAVFGECHAGTELYALAEKNANLALQKVDHCFTTNWSLKPFVKREDEQYSPLPGIDDFSAFYEQHGMRVLSDHVHDCYGYVLIGKLAEKMRAASVGLPEYQVALLGTCLSANLITYRNNPGDAFVSPAVVFATAQGNCREYAMVLQVLLSQVAPSLRAKIAVSIRAGHSFVEVYLPAFDRYYYIEPQYDGSDWAVFYNEHGAGAPRKGACSTDNRCFLDRFDIAVSVPERDGLCALESIGPRDWWQGLGEADRWRCLRQYGRGPLRWCNIEGTFCPAYDGLR